LISSQNGFNKIVFNHANNINFYNNFNSLQWTIQEAIERYVLDENFSANKTFKRQSKVFEFAAEVEFNKFFKNSAMCFEDRIKNDQQLKRYV
jgi:hypothetical protein